MSDIVERLREVAERADANYPAIMERAAARIEKLEDALIDAGASLAAAISLLERGGKKAAASDKMFAVMLSDYQKSMDRARAALEDK